jgi:hypothetical protein
MGTSMRVVFDIVGFAVIAFLIVQFVRGLTLSRTDRADDDRNSWTGGDDFSGGHGH